MPPSCAQPPAILRPWRDPAEVAAAMAGAPGLMCLLSDGGPDARWSYVLAEPTEVRRVAPGAHRPFETLRALLKTDRAAAAGTGADDPPFRGGVAGLAAYDLAAPTPAGGPDPHGWPGLILARHDRLLAFDHHQRRVLAIGADVHDAEQAARWLDRPAPSSAPPSGPLARAFAPDRPGAAYVEAAADVVARIAAGEIFQANIARAWSGALAPGARPLDLFMRLARQSPAPYAAFWDLDDLALVSNSPEAFLSLRDRRIESRPIKGTRPRGASPALDQALKRELAVSAKDRAENLMIVDLMRNDLSRVCAPGSVTAPRLFQIESFANVHHLVSTVTGRLADGADAANALEATFPPGSITGAPKHQAMRVIAGHEAGRGPWCGSLFLAGDDGSLSASVLIRTVALRRTGADWTLRALAGAGIVADSDPRAELAETEAKMAGVRRALCDPAAPDPAPQQS